MTTNEETIAMGGEKKEVKKSNASREWKNVAIGGAAGIMFGAGSAYAAGKLANGDEAAEEGNNVETGTSANNPHCSAKYYRLDKSVATKPGIFFF